MNDDKQWQESLWAIWWKAVGESDLRRQLMEHWDPIGVRNSLPITWDEYDNYINPIGKLLFQHAPVESIATYLDEVTDKEMGLGKNSSLSRRAAEALVAWYQINEPKDPDG